MYSATLTHVALKSPGPKGCHHFSASFFPCTLQILLRRRRPLEEKYLNYFMRFTFKAGLNVFSTIDPDTS